MLNTYFEKLKYDYTYIMKQTSANNVYYDIPAFMNDGRMATNYSPDAYLNNQLLTRNRITTNAEYRDYLMRNADKIINDNQIMSIENVSNVQVKDSIKDNQGPRGFQDSDLKSLYLSRDQHQEQVLPSI